MKKILISLSLFAFAIGVAIVFKKAISHQPSAISHKGGDASDIAGYEQWEYKRLVDPATGKIPPNIRYLELQFAATLPNDLQSSLKGSEQHNPLSASAAWQMRGPWNVGGRTRAFAPDITNEGILLAGTAAGGIWRSADSGKSWNLTTQL